jgi:hypothetical protein
MLGIPPLQRMSRIGQALWIEEWVGLPQTTAIVTGRESHIKGMYSNLGNDFGGNAQFSACINRDGALMVALSQENRNA